MLEQSLLINLTSPGIAENTSSQLRQEYQTCQNHFQAQPTLVQQYLGTQATSLAEAILQGLHQAQFQPTRSRSAARPGFGDPCIACT